MLITMERSRRWKKGLKFRRAIWASSRQGMTLQVFLYQRSSRIAVEEVTDDVALEIMLKKPLRLGHRPRWMAFGILTIVIYCLMNGLPHFIYGPGEDALSLTVEYGAVKDDEVSKAVQDLNNKKLLCQKNGKDLDIL